MAWLIVVQLISGAALATYELGTFLLLFEAVPDGERTSVMVRFVLLTHVATVLGSFAGAAALTAMSEAGVTGTGHGQAAYFAVFAMSAVARLATLALLARVRQPADLPTTPASATLQIHPAPGTLDEPLLPSISSDEPRLRAAPRDAD
jgi:MFS family permease